MKHEMRRTDRQVDIDEAFRIADSIEYGVLGTVSPDGEPYAVPVNFVRDGWTLYVHCATIGRKLENLEHEKRVCFTVVNDVELMPEKFGTKYASAMMFGTANIVTDESEREHALELLIQKWHSEFYESGIKYIAAAKDKTLVIRIDVAEVSGKASR